jgi:DNA-binding MarR family transcriptional regulator
VSSKKSGPPSVIWLLKHVQSALRAAIEQALAPLGLTASQAALLSALAYDPGLSNAELARGSFMTPQSMVELLRGLEERELIVRHPDPSGGRAMQAELTARGAQQLSGVRRAMSEVEGRLLRELSPDERGNFREMLERCLSSLREE